LKTPGEAPAAASATAEQQRASAKRQEGLLFENGICGHGWHIYRGSWDNTNSNQGSDFHAMLSTMS